MAIVALLQLQRVHDVRHRSYAPCRPCDMLLLLDGSTLTHTRISISCCGQVKAVEWAEWQQQFGL